jgi:hypothetical protein
MAGAGIQYSCQVSRSNECLGLWLSEAFRQWIAKNKITVALNATVKSLNLRADCHMPDLTACIPGNLSADLGNPQST